MSHFYISIRRHDGSEVHVVPGGQAERDLHNEVKARLKKLGVGWFKSEAKVLAAVDAAMRDIVFSVKSDIVPPKR
jgi:hypothetical protein